MNAATHVLRLRGWPLWWLSTATIGLATLWILLTTPGYAGVGAALRLTARTSFVLFTMAFLAGPLARLYRNGLTLWMRENRRHLGLAFAASHAIHLWVIVTYWNDGVAAFMNAQPVIGLYTNIVGYVVIAAMVATSFQATRHMIGPRAWALLHTAGGYYIWLSFAKSYFPRAATQAFYVPFALVLVGILIIRWRAYRLRGTGDT